MVKKVRKKKDKSMWSRGAHKKQKTEPRAWNGLSSKQKIFGALWFLCESTTRLVF